MSKIGNLFKKIFKKKKSSSDLDDIFDDTIDDSGEDDLIGQDELPEFDDSDIPKEDIPVKEMTKEHFVDDLSIDDEEPAAADHTKEIDISALEQQPLAGDELLDDYEDFEEEPSLESYTEEDSDFDYTMGTGVDFENEIDLDNSKITFKDKIEHLGTRVMDRFRVVGKKDLNQAMKPPRGEKTNTNINIKVPALNKAVKGVKGVQWDNLIDDLLKTSKRPKIHRIFQHSFTFLLVYIVASSINFFIAGKKDYKNIPVEPIIVDQDNAVTATKLNQIKSSKVFKTNKVIVDKGPTKKKIDMTKCTRATTKSSLPIKLYHTVVLQDAVKSIASVTVRSSNKVMTVRQGDKIGSNAILNKIERMNLIIKNTSTGDCESVPSSLKKEPSRKRPQIGVLSPGASRKYKKKLKKVEGIETDGNSFKIKRSILQEKMKDVSSLLTQARGVPINNPDGTMSFKIVEIQPDSVFLNLGIQNGDIITSINGEPIESVSQVMGLFGKITKIDKLNLGISRGGEAVEQNYNIK